MEQSIQDPAVLLKLKPINCMLRTEKLPASPLSLPPPPSSMSSPLLQSVCFMWFEDGVSHDSLSFTKINRKGIHKVISTQRLVPFFFRPTNLLPLIIFYVNFSSKSNQVNPIAANVYKLHSCCFFFLSILWKHQNQ